MNTESSQYDPLNVVDMIDSGSFDKNKMPSPRQITHDLKIEGVNKAKEKTAAATIERLPVPGTSVHFLSSGKFDFWSVVPVLVDMMGGVGEFLGSTWTMNRKNVAELLTLYDTGRIKSIVLLTGTYFQRRETAVYATVLAGLAARKQKFACFQNHTKIILLENGQNYITIEGSANFTSNPRLEQFVISNHQPLFDFHRTWMMEIAT